MRGQNRPYLSDTRFRKARRFFVIVCLVGAGLLAVAIFANLGAGPTSWVLGGIGVSIFINGVAMLIRLPAIYRHAKDRRSEQG